MPNDVTVHVWRGGVRRRRRSRGRRRSGTGGGRRPQQAPGARTLQAEVLHLREELHLLADNFGSFTARLPELLAEHSRRQQRAVRFGMQQQVEDLAAGQAEVLRLLRAPRDVDDTEPAPVTSAGSASSSSSESSKQPHNNRRQ